MRRKTLLILLTVALALVGVYAGYAISAPDANQGTPTTQAFTFTNVGVATYTIPDPVTVTVTVEQPPPPPPPTNNCTKIASAGADLSTFLATLSSGDVGCLHGGEYTDGCALSWSGTGATLTNYPNEVAVVHTSLGLAGSGLTVSGLEITIPSSCGTGTSGMTVQGADDVISMNYIHDVPRHGILTNTSSSNVTIHGNFIANTGSTCNLDHGIYFQTSGRITRNVIVNSRCGYGIQLYASPHDTVVAENTSVGSQVRSGLVIVCSSNCKVVNNIFTNNRTAGFTYRSCGSGCLVDNNITWNNPVDCEDALCSSATNTRHVDPMFSDSRYHVLLGSPAIDTARADYAFFPDLDGVQAVLGAGPDMGAYETR